MPDIIQITVSAPPPAIKVTVSDTNAELITATVSDVINGSGASISAKTVVFEGVVGGDTELTGTVNILTGFIEGSDLITLEDFVNVRVEIQRGGQDSPKIGSYAGFTKDLNSDSILLSSALEDGEYLKIKTIPR